jgi:DNA-binding MarR family transcriptional regulator
VTPSQAGVLLFLRHHVEARVTNTATALGVNVATLSRTVTALVHKQCVAKRRPVTDTRALCLRLSRRGLVLTRKIENQV